MILTRTPVRVSLCGGGLDFPAHYEQHGGLVLSGAINKHSYVAARHYPPYHDHKTRVVYSSVETVQCNRDIQHRAVRETIKFLGLEEAGLEISHVSDLPGMSGTGSSSTFVVGLLNALSALQGQLKLPQELATSAIQIERGRLGEAGGHQDQIAAAYGDLNVIRFHRGGGWTVAPLVISAEHVRELESHLLLFYTRIPRRSGEITASYADKMMGPQQFALQRITEQAIDAVYGRRWEMLGNLIDQSWRIKSGLSGVVTTNELNRMYNTGRVCGAWGGKVTGSGGGGCLLFVAPPEKHEEIKGMLGECVHIPFRFEPMGSHIVFCERC